MVQWFKNTRCSSRVLWLDSQPQMVAHKQQPQEMDALYWLPQACQGTPTYTPAKQPT